MGQETGPVLSTTLQADTASLTTAILEGISEYIALIDSDFRIVGVNANLATALGRSAEALLGTSAIDIIAPADRDRAALILGFAGGHGALPGAAPFDMLRADGSVLTIEIAGSELVVGDIQAFTLIGRPTYESIAVSRVLDRLLAGRDLTEILEPVLDLFAWRQAGSRIAIAWSQDGSTRSVSTLLPNDLTGRDPVGDPDPWAAVRRTGVAIRGRVDEVLDPAALALSAGLGLQRIWIEPVTMSGSSVKGLVTVWSGEQGFSPDIHAFGVHEAKRYLSLVLRWQDQARRLDAAAHSDELTGLANRRAFFDVLSSTQGGGAVLFADLDGFKTVNDRWSHATGDALLVEVGRRLARSVRDGDCVARTGGDEFAVAMRGASPSNALEVAERIRQACAEPFHLNGTTVSIGISVGIAHHETDLGEATLDAADRDQYTHKRRRARANPRA